MLKDKTVLLGITGGIAAYKVCSLIRLYKKAGANVRVVVTPNALNFVTKLTLQTLSQNEVYIENFEINEYKPEHISLTESDIFVIAPASANTISKIANGICDNLLLSTACAYKNPVLIVPAMNDGMWKNKFVQENIEKLERAGYYILEPDSGFLACGTNAVGRMKEPEEIFSKTVEILDSKKILTGKKILITAGGTKEKLDPVRYITNCSSGKMGIALAQCASKMGAEVTLVSTFPVKDSFYNIVAETAQEMENAVKSRVFDNDYIIMAAAVADYRAANYSEQKIKKGDDEKISIELIKNPDILKEISTIRNSVLKENGKSPIIIGFCAESENLEENAKIKIQKKGCDYIIANDISRKDIGFNTDENEVLIINKNLNTIKLEKNTKQNISKQIFEHIVKCNKMDTLKV